MVLQAGGAAEEKRGRSEEGDMYEGNGESDSSVGSVSNSRLIFPIHLFDEAPCYATLPTASAGKTNEALECKGLLRKLFENIGKCSPTLTIRVQFPYICTVGMGLTIDHRSSVVDPYPIRLDPKLLISDPDSTSSNF